MRQVMRNPVRVSKVKYDGRVTRQLTGDLVEATEDGWLVVFHDSSRHESFWQGKPAPAPPYSVDMLSQVLPLTVHFRFDEKGALFEAYVDVALPATIEGREIAYIDLEIDLVGLPDGSYRIKDIEEFELHRVEYGYTEEVVATAQRGIDLAERAFLAREFPFDGTAERILGRELASEGPL